MDILKIEKDNWLLEIDLNGGRIVSLIKENNKILGTYNRIDGKIGNTHVCIPNFANEGVEKFGFVFHGPFRNSEWKLINQSKSGINIILELDGLSVTQSFEIKDGFNHKILIRNVSDEKKRIHVAVHNYWDTEFGWKGIRLNGHDISGGFIDNPEINLEKNNILEIPNKKVIKWQVENFGKAKLWTGVKEEGGGKTYDNKYVCIEPEMEYEGFVETDRSLIEPKKCISVEQKIG